MATATLHRNTSKKKFIQDLMLKYDGSVTVDKQLIDGPEEDLDKAKSPWMHLFYTTVGLTDEMKSWGSTDRHCGTWMHGKGWEFLSE